MRGKIVFLASLLGAILFGYFCAEVVFKEYQKGDQVFSEGTNLYLLQQGVYTKKEAIPQNARGVEQSLMMEEDGKYYVYIGMTQSKELAEKIQKIYDKEKVVLYIREEKIDNSNFLKEVEQYDVLLEASKSKTEIDSVLKTVLATYEETVLKK